MEEVVGKYLGNERIVGDQVLMILYWHVFVKYWVVVTTPINHYPETVITLQFISRGLLPVLVWADICRIH